MEDSKQEQTGQKIQKRACYTKEERQAVLDLLPYTTAKKLLDEYGVKESTIRNWKGKPDLEDQRKFKGPKKLQLDDLEKKLEERLLDMLKHGISLPEETIIEEMSQLYMAHYSINKSQYELLQKWIKYSKEKNIPNDEPVKWSFEREWAVLNNNNETYILNLDEKIILRESIFKVKPQFILFDNQWASKFTEKGFAFKNVVNWALKENIEEKEKVQLSLSIGAVGDQPGTTEAKQDDATSQVKINIIETTLEKDIIELEIMATNLTLENNNGQNSPRPDLSESRSKITEQKPSKKKKSSGEDIKEFLEFKKFKLTPGQIGPNLNDLSKA